MQHIEDNTEQDTEQHTENRTQDTTICSAHNYRTYSLDYYFEYAYIKNSNTIELYTILQDKVQKTLISSLYSFDFIVYDNTSKNSITQTIYKLYTNYIHFGHLIYEVSK